MKKLFYLLFAAISLTAFNSCKKETVTTSNNYTWTLVNKTPVQGGWPGNFMFFYDDGSALYTAQEDGNTGYSGTFPSIDNGVAWTRISGSCTEMIKSGNNLILNGSIPRIYSGGSLTNINGLCDPQISSFGCLGFNGLTIASNTNVLAATIEGIVKSTDNGFTWTKSNTGIPTFASGGTTKIMGMEKMITVGQYVFAASDVLNSNFINTIIKSSDNGNTWTQSNNGLGLITNSANFKKFLSLGNTVYLLYSVGSNIILFKTLDFGATWSQISFTFPNNEKLISLASKNTDIYALTDGHAVYKSTTNGNSWSKISPDEIFYNEFGDPHKFDDIIVAGNKLLLNGLSAIYTGSSINEKGLAYYTKI